MNKGLILSICLLSFCKLSAQSITPFTLNIAGFTSQKSGYSLTISTGEAISITNFTTPSGVSLNSGFLQNNQPLITGVDELSKLGATEITLIPNPTSSFTNLVANFSKPGHLQFQILNVNSKLLFRSNAQPISSTIQSKIDFSIYPAGVYYVHIFFKPLSGNSKTGIYKIVKL